MPVLYDDDCGFCRVSLALVLAWDRRGRLRPVAIQSEEGQRLLAALPEAERLASAHVITPAGELRSAGAVAEPLLRALPGGRPLARLAARAPHLTESAYRAVAGRRDRIGPRVPASVRRWADTRLTG